MTAPRLRVLAPPPVIFAAGFIAGIAAHLAAPLHLFRAAWVGHSAGWPLFAASVFLAAWAFAVMRGSGEHPDPARPTGFLITTGPFSRSRNPFYVAATVAYIGVALIVNSGWPLVLIPAVLVIVRYGVIVREERYLEALFGDEYRRYRERVRRWL